MTTTEEKITPMRMLVGLLTLIMVRPALLAADTEKERLEDSAQVLEEILNVPDALPKELLNKAECVAIMPSVKESCSRYRRQLWTWNPGLPDGQ